MHSFRIAFFCLGLSSTAAHAFCIECDEVVELDESGVSCLQNQLLQRLPEPDAKEPEEYSLEKCGADSFGNRGGLLTMPRLIDGAQPKRKLKVVYRFDNIFAVCLLDLLQQQSRPVAETVTYDLFALCRK